MIRLEIVVLYNGTKKALPCGSAIKVRYTKVLHCIDTGRVSAMECNAMQRDTIESVSYRLDRMLD